jgi:precorrin-6Y C5,15-methyltransferase (decarboxylating)
VLADLVEQHADRRLVLLASGDPMFFGIGATLARLVGTSALDVLPHPSSVSYAAARLGWPVDDLDVVSLVGRPLETLHPSVQPGRRLLVLVSERGAAVAVRDLLSARGFATSTLTVLAQLGGPDEAIGADLETHDPLAIVAVECVADPSAPVLPRTPGLPDEMFESDGQLTKREVRALALAALQPVPGQLLWDVGAGSGSIGIEWMRTHPSCRALAIEPRADRRDRIVRNACALGVPALRVVEGAAPAALAGLPSPDAVFVGGGVSVDGVLGACVTALAPGGRLVANGVTVQTETVLAGWHTRLGGTLTRIAVQRAEPVGGFTGWRPAMPVTQWTYRA